MFLLLFSFLFLVLLITVFSDFHSRKIPSWLTYSIITVAVVYHTILKGLEGLPFSSGKTGA